MIDKRYLKGNGPGLLTTNKEPQQWGQVLHRPDLSAAILDRLLDRGEVLKLGGRSTDSIGRVSRRVDSYRRVAVECGDFQSCVPI